LKLYTQNEYIYIFDSTLLFRLPRLLLVRFVRPLYC